MREHSPQFNIGAAKKMSLDPDFYIKAIVEDENGTQYTLIDKTASYPGAFRTKGLLAQFNNYYGAFENNATATMGVEITDTASAFITKLYGSVKGRSKLVFVGKGNRSVAPIGSIVYYTDYSLADTETAYIYEESDLDGLCNQAASIVVEGKSINTQFVKEVHLGARVTRNFGDYFLFGFTMLDTIDIGESGVTSIGDYAFSGCYELRKNDIVLPQTLTSIGSFFMNMCSNFEGILDVGSLPASIITVDSYSFGVSGPNMPIYANGCKIRGTTKWDWIDRLPNSYSLNPQYRNLQPADIDYGIVYYKTSSSSSTIERVELQNATEFDSLAGSTAWTTTVGASQITVSAQGDNCVVGIRIGDKITSTPSYFMSRTNYLSMPMYIPSNIKSLGTYFLYYSGISNQVVRIDANLTSLPGYFMYYCSSFNLYVTLPSTITSIGNYFMYYCRVFNQNISIPSAVKSIGAYFLANAQAFNRLLTLPSALTTIGSNFLRGCYAFNRSLTLPSTLTSIGTYFMYLCNAMVGTVNVGALAETIASSSNYTFATTSSTAACYTTGITIKGSNRAAWLSRFANRTSSPYRKLLDAGS